jgi:hypothetical protein
MYSYDKNLLNSVLERETFRTEVMNKIETDVVLSMTFSRAGLIGRAV